MKLKNSRGIVTKLICCTALVVLTSAVAFSQITPNKPTSGALLSIDGTAGSTPVHMKLYDSQIHSGTVQAAPTCGAADQIPTDAYVLQGGSATGCDPGDDFEVTDSNDSGHPHQAPGKADLAGFHIETHYLCAGSGANSCTDVTGSAPSICNTSNSICAGPDTGLLTVTNTGSSGFTGTITLTGTSPTTQAQSAFCPPGGMASDSFNGTLAGSGAGSVTLALSTDSSNCGGFNQAQTLNISNAGPSTASFGKDKYIITPSTAQAGDTLDVLPVPVPAGPTGTEQTPATSILTFSPGTKFSNLKCIPYADFSGPNNPVCVELQLSPGGTSGDGGNYIYTAENDFNIDGRSLSGGVGGPSFLGHHGVGCPDNAFDLNFFLSYTAPSATVGDPLKGSGGGTGSCWVAAFDPNVGAVTEGAMVGFFGFQSPVVDTKINVVKAGSSVPLKWQQFKGDGTAETGLSWCQTLNMDGTCNTPSNLGTPWVFLGTFPIACPNDTLNTATDTTSSLASGKSGFQANFPSAGFYQFNWQTDPKSTGCVALVLQYDTGIQVFQAIFKYSKT